MPKKYFQKLADSADQLRHSNKLGPLRRFIHDPNLWHLNRHSVSRAFFAAFFTSLTFMLVPGHMFTAALVAIWIRGNIPIAMSLVWLVNPLTIPPLAIVALKIGGWIMPGAHHKQVDDLLHFEWHGADALSVKIMHFWHVFEKVWQPFMLGSLVLGLSIAIASYCLVQLFWRIHVIRTWNARQKKRRLKERSYDNHP